MTILGWDKHDKLSSGDVPGVKSTGELVRGLTWGGSEGQRDRAVAFPSNLFWIIG